MTLRLRFTFSLIVAVFTAVFAVDAQQTLPFFDGFEDAEASTRWTFVQSTARHKWYIGSGAYLKDSTGLYVSADGGATPGYTNSAKGIAAFTTLNLDAGTYTVSFDYRMVGEVDSKGVGLDSLFVYWITNPSANIIETNGDRPKSLETYRQPITNNDNLQGPELWHNTSFQVRVRGTNVPVRLAFYWVNNSANIVPPGVCIDNLQVMSEDDPCTQPQNFTVTHEGGAKLSWDATSATHYQICYKNNSTGVQSVIDNVTDNPYYMSALEKGIYTFWVRGICGTDTSAWATFGNHVLAVSTDKCINFIDIHNPNVVECRYGRYGETPIANVGCMDFGFESKESRHTVCYQQNVFDNNVPELPTICPGDLASVRIGNQRGQSESESMEYTITVDAANPILVVKYAAVLMNVGHDGSDLKQPRFIIRVTDARGIPLDQQCLSVEYLTGSPTLPPGWNRIPIGSGQVGDEIRQFYIEWKNWTTMGMNLAPYIGRTLKVYIETGNCTPAPDGLSCYGYTYFSMDCVSDKLDGLTCGANAASIDTVWAPSGFRYEWVKKSNPNKVLFTDQFLAPAAGDTATYICRMHFRDPGREACSFELEAALAPRFAVANASYIPCRTTINFIDSSSVITANGTSKEIPDVFWDFGDGKGTSTEHNPIYTYETAGEYEVVLRASIDDGECDSIWSTIIQVTTETQITTDTMEVCPGERVLFGDRYLREPGIYVDSLYNIYGCDSISILDLRYHDTHADSVICGGDVFVFEGKEYYLEPGTHDFTYTEIKSVFGCDSTLVLVVSDAIEIQPQLPFCADDPEARFALVGGIADSVRITIAAEPFNAVTVPVVDGEFALPFTADVMAGKYSANMLFYNQYCGSTENTVSVTINYPSSVITQRWNDVLALKNQDYNGGYNFAGAFFQWYEGGDPLAGQIYSIYYTEGTTLDIAKEYSVMITTLDGVSIMTCPFQPIEVPTKDDDITVTFRKTEAAAEVVISPQSADNIEVRVFDSLGRLCNQTIIQSGQSYINIPISQGIYFIHFSFSDGRSEVRKVIRN